MAAPLGSSENRLLHEVQGKLEYQFRRPGLLLQALTHGSFCHENPNCRTGNNDELEWLGDTVLQMVVTNWLFHDVAPPRSSGTLSQRRQKYTSTGACIVFAQQLALASFLRVGVGQAVIGTKVEADCFEAVLGALYLDSGGLSAIDRLMAHLIPGFAKPEPQPPVRWRPRPAKKTPAAEEVSSSARASSAGSIAEAKEQEQAPPPPPRAADGGAPSLPPVEWPRRVLHHTQRLSTALRRLPKEGGPEAALDEPDSLGEVEGAVADLQTALTGLYVVCLQDGQLSHGLPQFAECFGAEVQQWLQHVLAPDGGSISHRQQQRNGPHVTGEALVQQVLREQVNIRKAFPNAPLGAEKLIMAVVRVPQREREGLFAALDFVKTSLVVQPRGGRGEGPADEEWQWRWPPRIASLPAVASLESSLRQTLEAGATCLLFAPPLARALRLQ